MHTPRPKYSCPGCKTTYETDQKFCGRCGANMKSVSGLIYLERQRDRGAEPPRSRPARAATSESSDSWDEDDSFVELAEPVSRKRRSADHDRWLGTVVDDRYQVIEVIGRGGMGVVYRVEHVRMGKVAAMKVLHHDLESDREVARRFRTEAEAISRLTHPNTVQVFDFGTARGALYLVMEFVRGRDIGSIVGRDGPLSFSRAAPLFGQIAAALGEAHERGVVHRDLKPENILVTRTHGGHDFVKVLDFGLAKLAERDDLVEDTSSSAIVGTPYYMSPEQIRGDPIDRRADIYSLGALMYRVLTGEQPFRAKSPVGVLTKHLTEPLVPPSKRRPDLDLPPELDAIIGRAMAKRRRERYGKVADLAADMAALYASVEGHSAASRLTSAWLFPGAATASPREVAREIDYGIDTALRLRRSDLDRYERSLRRRHWMRLLIVPAVLVAAAAGIWFYLSYVAGQPVTAESEPNNSIGGANPIAPGKPVTGYLGRRASRTEPDRDFYRVRRDESFQSVSVAVSELPNIDISLSLYDLNGRLLDHVDEGGVGEPEAIRNRRARGALVVMVSEAREPDDDRLPVENVSDTYRLVVTRARLDPARELEPNETVADACELIAARPVNGFLDRRRDIDQFRFDGVPGRYRLAIRGAAGVPIQWTAGERSGTGRTATVELEAGSVVRLERAASEPGGSETATSADVPYTLELSPAGP